MSLLVDYTNSLSLSFIISKIEIHSLAYLINMLHVLFARHYIRRWIDDGGKDLKDSPNSALIVDTSDGCCED